MKKNLLKPVIASTVVAFMLGGCYNQPGLVEDHSYNRTKTGALAGAITGALIGYKTKGHHKGRRAALGALAGATLGGGLGYMLDKQANEVAAALGTGVSTDPLAAVDPRRDIIVTKHPTYVKVLFRDDMMFATGSAKLRPSARYKVQKLASVLHQYPQTIVGVAGFTDNRGSFAYNQKLSEARARSVAGLLQTNSYPKTKGCSYNKPLAPNDSAVNRALNRRVEVYLFADPNNMVDPCRY